MLSKRITLTSILTSFSEIKSDWESIGSINKIPPY